MCAFADDLRAGGHIVHTPDLFDGRTFQSIDEGLAYIGEIGFDEMRERGVRGADELPPELVYAGFSFGVLPAQKLAQTRPGARGALLFCSCLPISGEWAFGPWSDGVAVQIHGMENPQRDDAGVEGLGYAPAGLCRPAHGRTCLRSSARAAGWSSPPSWQAPV